MAGIRFLLKTDYEQAKNAIEDVLGDQGFSLDYSDPYNVMAERGSKTATMLAGAFAGKKNQHLLLSINYGAWDQGGQVVSVLTANTGMAAGVIGVSRVQDAFIEITEAMRQSFIQQGFLAGEAPFQ